MISSRMYIFLEVFIASNLRICIFMTIYSISIISPSLFSPFLHDDKFGYL